MSTWYRTGTVALTNGNGTVTGTGTAWIANASIGEGFLAPDGRTYEITGIASNTSLTISPNYLGTNVTGQAYAIAPLRGRIAQLLSETSSLLASFATVRDGIGAGLFPDGTVSLPAFRFAADQDTGVFRPATNALGFVTGGLQRVTVTSAGDVGIGTASPESRCHSVAPGASIAHFDTVDTSGGTKAFAVRVTASSGAAVPAVAIRQWRASFAGNGSQGELRFDGLTTAGGYTEFASIYAVSGANSASGAPTNLTFQTTNTAFASAERMRITANGIVRPGADNTQNLGEASFRWATVFAGTGTINTSDEREKVWRGAMNEAEMRAAKRIIGELGMFQFIASVEEKGEEARLHFGVRAQATFAILEDEGLEPSRYAWCCYDEWEATPGKPATKAIKDDDGTVIQPARPAQPGIPAGNRYGIRSDQLAFWLIAAQAEIQSGLEARLAKLEAAK